MKNEVTKCNNLYISWELATKHNIKKKQKHRRWKEYLCGKWVITWKGTVRKALYTNFQIKTYERRRFNWRGGYRVQWPHVDSWVGHPTNNPWRTTVLCAQQDIWATPVGFSRAYARGGVGVKTPPWAWYFTKTLLPAQLRLTVFAYFLLVNLSTYCKYHRINLHANFKKHCKWAKK